MSWAAILIRLADAPPLVIAGYRLSMAAVILLPVAFMRSRKELNSLDGSTWGWAVLSGILLSIHFSGWISSLSYTSVASSVVIVTTYPIFVGIISHLFLREKVTTSMVTGILIAFSGGIVIGFGDFTTGGNALFGDGLALLGSISGAGYFLIGRRLRAHVSLLPYITMVYTTAAIVLVILAIGTGNDMSGYSWTTYATILLLAVGPQLLGHSSLNWALKYLSAVFVSISTLAEPVVSTALAALMLNEGITIGKIGGNLLVLCGIFVVMGQERWATAKNEIRSTD
ncbi:uncharacterized protein METZ01_LOCUS188668 [marine metagenome]|uniref:EamA domain-containing protein n=1 Tax=marine metagenome TaxID=408172 RepID=A0A382DCU9_9ZZZZ